MISDMCIIIYLFYNIMALDYKLSNPYLRKSTLQQSYPTSSLSCTSLLAPSISICPKKKYSTNNWYDYKSSNPELSEKVLYRMYANYYKLQTESKGDETQHIDDCLLSSYCKKNPFSRVNLLEDKRIDHSFSEVRKMEEHWTYERSKMNLKQPHMHKSYSQTMQEYKQLRKKVSEQRQKHNQQQQNRKAFKDTFGMLSEQKALLSSSQRFKQLLYQREKRLSGQQLQSNRLKNQQSLLSLVESQQKLLKNDSSGTFAYRRSFNQIPPKISYQGKTFFFLQLGQDKDK